LDVDTTAPSNSEQPGITDNTDPNKPIDVTDGQTKDNTPVFDGNGEPGDTVDVVSDGGTPNDPSDDVKCTTKVDATGKWSCEIGPLPDGDQTITTTKTDPAGNVSDPLDTPLNVDTIPPSVPVVDPTNGTEVSGTGEPGSLINVTDSTGALVDGCGDVRVGTDGKWSCAPTTPVNTGETLNVQAKDPAGNVSAPTQVVVAGIGIQITYPTRYAGEEQGVIGVNFHPGETVTGMVFSDPIALGSVTADANGVAAFPNFMLPADFEPGQHTVTLTGTGCGGDDDDNAVSSCVASGTVSDTFQVLTPKVIDTGIPGLGGDQKTALGIGMMAASAMLGGFLLLVGAKRREEDDTEPVAVR
jgi:hypothetical protein